MSQNIPKPWKPSKKHPKPKKKTPKTSQCRKVKNQMLKSIKAEKLTSWKVERKVTAQKKGWEVKVKKKLARVKIKYIYIFIFGGGDGGGSRKNKKGGGGTKTIPSVTLAKPAEKK